jgi:hypothetical protein
VTMLQFAADSPSNHATITFDSCQFCLTMLQSQLAILLTMLFNSTGQLSVFLACYYNLKAGNPSNLATTTVQYWTAV